MGVRKDSLRIKQLIIFGAHITMYFSPVSVEDRSSVRQWLVKLHS